MRKDLEKLFIEAKELWETMQSSLVNSFSMLAKDARQYCHNRNVPLSEAGIIGIQEQENMSSGLRERLKEVLFHRLVFPLHLPDKSIVGFSSRTIDNIGAKYLHQSICPEFKVSNLLFGFGEKITGKVWVVEGILDVLALRGQGEKAVSPFGTVLTFNQAAVISMVAEEVCLCLDADAAGRTSIFRMAMQFSQFGVIPVVVFPEQNKDPKETIDTMGYFTQMNICEAIKLINGEKRLDEYINMFASEEKRELLRSSI